MRIIYEKAVREMKHNALKNIDYESVSWIECTEAEAERIHYCYNDEEKPKPCRVEYL